MMSIFQVGRKFEKNGEVIPTIICTRDKDLRMVEGWHYGWECGAQPEFFPTYVEGMGEIRLIEKKNKYEIKGEGLKFFYSQLLTGDPVDNIAGLPYCGAKTAFTLLEECQSEDECFEAVRGAYEKKYGDSWREEMYEQAHLLWMVIRLDNHGNPVMWVMPDERK